MLRVISAITVLFSCSHTKHTNCKGEGLWNFGKLSPSQGEESPFIPGQPKGTCKISQEEESSIYRGFFLDIKKKPKKVAIFTMGPPGAGKSTAISKALPIIGVDRSSLVLFDPDAIRGKIGDYIRVTNIESKLCPGKRRAYQEATSWCIKASWDFQELYWERILASRKSFLHDTSCRGEECCINRMIESMNAGYHIYLIAVWTPVDVAVSRATERAFMTGRWTSRKFIELNYCKIPGNFQKALALISRDNAQNGVVVFDNSGIDAEIVYAKLPGRIENNCDKDSQACLFYSLPRSRVNAKKF